VDSTTWTDHTNLRPTILSMLGLKDDYTDDGRVLVEALTKQALPTALSASKVQELGDAYEQLNASFGDFAQAILAASTAAVEGPDANYAAADTAIANVIAQRDTLAGQIRAALNGAAFDNAPISNSTAGDYVSRAKSLLAQASSLAAS